MVEKVGKEYSHMLLRLARENQRHAWDEFNEEKYRFTASTAYYAIFYAGLALLDFFKSHPKTHKGFLNELRRLASEEKIPKDLTKIAAVAETLREKADYPFRGKTGLSKEVVQKELKGMDAFIKETEKLIL